MAASKKPEQAMSMKVAMITRSTLYSGSGGDTVQVTETARHLALLGVEVDIKLTHEKIDYNAYQLLHFFNITRPADILYHIKRSHVPFVVSTILIDYSEYDALHRKGIAGFLFRFLSGDTIEYTKTIARWLLGRDKLISLAYLRKGQYASICEIIKQSSILLPNSQLEHQRLQKKYGMATACEVVPNAIDTQLFQYTTPCEKDPLLVICVARIEGIKNQVNLIKALNGTKYRLLLIGSPAVNQHNYYKHCKELAGDNIQFIDHLPQDALLNYYRQAKTHILPSWFETTGLSSLEAAAMGCNIVISDRGDAKEYFGNHAFYCDPSSPENILAAVESAASAPCDEMLCKKITEQYTWQKAAEHTFNAYRKINSIA
jgi:glycosyltransferase involved in cell wall biosynthesis